MDRPGSLLVVEDENVLRSLVCHFLRTAGYKVSEAEDGAEGVKRYEEEGPFDLILLDLNLPVFSGIEVSRRVKARNPDQKIMILSAVIVRDHEEALFQMGVNHFLTKPYHPENLLAHIGLELARPIGSHTPEHVIRASPHWL
jgi:DNA-binding response OmpR family regulator